MNDLRYALRRLLTSPGFTLAATLSLALGIGANVALFSVINAVFLRPLPYQESDRLVRLASTDQASGLTRGAFSYTRFLEVDQRQQVFTELALSIGTTFTLTERGDDPEQVIGLRASATLLPTLGLQPIVGRNFALEDDRPGGPRVVLISPRMWQQRFNRSQSVLGRTLVLDGAPYAVIGVLPEAATAFPLNQPQVWVSQPAASVSQTQLDGGSMFFQAIARLEPGVSLDQARAAMTPIAARYRVAHPGNVDAASVIELLPLLDDTVSAQRKSYGLLLGAVACLLLIACANIANLLLARFSGRRREIAARYALGASRGAIIGQLVTESVLLAALGGVAGLLLAWWAVRALTVVAGNVIPRAAEISLDLPVLGFTLIVTLVTALVIGALPAMHASRVNVSDALRATGAGSVGSGRGVRAGLLIAEVSLSLVLLIAAGLLMTSFARLQRVDPGFEPAGVFTAEIALPRSYSRERLVEFYERFSQRITRIPGAASAAFTDRVPLTGDQPPTVVAVAGGPMPPLNERPYANRHLVSPNYFRTLGIQLRAGRDFDERDDTRVPHVAIINETFARRLFPGVDPIGRTLVTGMAQTPAQVIGVVADIRGENLSTPPQPEYFLPALQRPELSTNVLVRSALPPAVVASLVREALRPIDADLPLLRPEALTARAGQTLANRKLALALLSTFAALALALAALGVYSVMAHLVAGRTSEIGLRMALGASPDSAMWMVLTHGRRLTLAGIAVGVAGALVVSRLMQQALFEVDPADPVVYVGLSVALLVVAECAAFLPARRATRIDPLIALRTQ